MNKYLIKFCFSSLLALCPIIVPASNLPVLPPDGQIKSGRLGNGISYYLVSNNRGSGQVDFALVQKVGREDEPELNAGEAIISARTSINELPHFVSRSPFAFLHGKSIWPNKDGYVKVSDDATVYCFSGTDNSPGREMVDSTLLMLFDIIGRRDGPMKNKYIPHNQAVIVAGDIDVQAVLGKMNMLSLLVTDKKGELKTKSYTWKTREGIEYRAEKAFAPSLASVCAEYSFPRTPLENMSSVLPLVSSRYFSELSVILRRRIERSLRQEGIAFASVDFNYKASSSGAGDEKYRVKINTSAEDLKGSASVLAQVLADVDRNGIVSGEYRDAINESVSYFKKSDQYDRIKNEYYLETCISAFLYGSSLSSSKTNLDFFAKRNVDDEISVKLFNNFVSAILDKSNNLALICEAESASLLKEEVLEAFSQSWDKTVSGSIRQNIISSSDTTGLRPSKSKSKIKTVATEPVSGGQLWLFSNGVKVIYKRIPSSNHIFYYSWLVKGSYSRIKEVSGHDWAYFQDMLNLYNVAGMPSARFRNMLSANGIDLDCEASPSEIFIRGSAPSERLHLLFKSLLSLAEDRSLDTKAFAYYKKCEALRHAYSKTEIQYKKTVLDSIINQGNEYSAYKRASGLHSGLQENAEKVYAKAFSRMNDGVLIIIGDMEEAYVRKQLLQYMGSFNTDRASSHRSAFKHKNIAGRAFVAEEALEPSINISLSAPLNLTAENYMAGIIAGRALRESAAGAAASCGWRVFSDGYFSMLPEESLNLNLYMSMAASEGLPASMMRKEDAEEVLSSIRKAIHRAGEKGINTETLAAGKAEVASMFSRWGKDPSFIRYILELRYAYGKDIINGYEKKLGTVTAATVNPILKTLAEGRISEYMVKSKEKINEAILCLPLFPSVPELIPSGFFTYPFGEMKVPLDTVDLKSLESLFVPHHEIDTVSAGSAIDTILALPQNTLAFPAADSLSAPAVLPPSPKPDTLSVTPASPKPNSLSVPPKPDTIPTPVAPPISPKPDTLSSPAAYPKPRVVPFPEAIHPAPKAATPFINNK